MTDEPRTNAEIERLTNEAADIIQRLSDRLEAANADAKWLLERLLHHLPSTMILQEDRDAIAAHDARVKAAEADANDLVDREGEAEAYAWWRSQQ